MKKKRLRLFLLLIIIILFTMNIDKLAKKVYPYKYREYVEIYSEEYNLDPYLVVAIIKAESKFDPKAKSHKDAYGLMQLTYETASWISKQMNMKNFNESMLYDPKVNISMGCWYVNNLLKEFNGDKELALAAYNAGIGNVEKWLMEKEHSKDGKTLHYIPYKETDKYVKKVKVNYNIYKNLYSNKKSNKIELIKSFFGNMSLMLK